MDILVYSLVVILLATALAVLIFLAANRASNKAHWLKDKHSERVIVFLREALDEYRFGKITSVKLVYGPHLQRIFCSHMGIEMLNQILDQMQPWQQDEVAGLMETIGYETYLLEQLSHDNKKVLSETIHLINMLKILTAEEAVYEIVLKHQTVHDIQYEGLSLLAKRGDSEHLLALSHNDQYMPDLSFEELDVLFSEYSGDKEELYNDFLESDNPYLRRLIIKNVGREKCYNFFSWLMEMYESDSLSAEERLDIAEALDALSSDSLEVRLDEVSHDFGMQYSQV